MIRTVTLNSGFDEVFIVTNLPYGGVGDVIRHDTFASGKGFNAARVIRVLGEPVKAYGFIGDADKDEFSSRLSAEGIDSELVGIAGKTRRNLTVLDVSNGLPAAHVKGEGFRVDSDQPLHALMEVLARDIQPGDIVTLNGSTPAGVVETGWAEVGRLAVERGATLLIDIYGSPLLHVLTACNVFLCKPNQEEIHVFPAHDSDLDNVQSAIAFMRRNEVTLPIVTLGKDGLCFGVAESLFVGTCEVERATMLVGAGDACLAGLAIATARKNAPIEIASYGVAVASAYVSAVGSNQLASETGRLLSTVSVQPFNKCDEATSHPIRS